MFQSARIKLTAWYLAIIMVISLSFSLVIYGFVNNELTRIERFQRSRFDRVERVFQPELDASTITQARERVGFILLSVNLLVLAISGLAGYFLAGRTLTPIKEMIDDQNRFVADASHELRTPLTVLRSEIEVAIRSKTITLKDAKDLIKSNLEEIMSLQSLSDNLIKLAQYQKNHVIVFETVSLKQVLSDALKKVSKLAQNKQIEMKNGVTDIALKGDKKSLTELFVIFLDNAIKYSSKGQIVEISSKKLNGFVEISITDQGIGIDKVDLPHIFDRFYRADKSRSKEVTGYGLGLSIAKQIVDKHRGIIKVTSQKGKGTNFRILLPRNS